MVAENELIFHCQSMLTKEETDAVLMAIRSTDK